MHKNNQPEELQGVSFQRSSLCTTGQCVEVAIAKDGAVHVRDNKNTSQAPLTFTSTEWKAFVGGVKNGEFDIAQQ